MILLLVIIRGKTAEIITNTMHDTNTEDEEHAKELIDAMTGAKPILSSGTRKTDGAQITRN